uniref:Uncharacterized protein n=1 Tax=Rhizophora mucronata TaxID=61149 RepID=A0A2P2PH65_RHIMU
MHTGAFLLGCRLGGADLHIDGMSKHHYLSCAMLARACKASPSLGIKAILVLDGVNSSNGIFT